jgi:hypothetical protein
MNRTVHVAAEMCDKGLCSGTLKEIQIGMFQEAVTDCLYAAAAK